MSDAKDAVRAAKAQNQRLAASCMVRKEALTADLAALEKQRADAAELAADTDSKTNAEASAILRSIEERMTEKRSELASADRDLKQALDEVRELDKLAGRAAALDAQAIAASALGGDPFIRSPEEIALDNARGHIGNLEAHTRVETDVKRPSPLMTEAEARAKLEEMRAKLRSDSKPLDSKPLDSKPLDSKPLDSKPKKTL